MCNKDPKVRSALNVMQAFVDDKNVEKLVKKTPFFAFPLLATFIEFLGKTLDHNDWHDNKGLTPFDNAIKMFQPFKQYKCIKDLRDSLRNGMVHSYRAKGELKLSAKNNNFDECVIGCEELFMAIKKTVEEIQNGVYDEYIEKNLNTPFIFIENNITGSTETQKYIKS